MDFVLRLLRAPRAAKTEDQRRKDDAFELLTTARKMSITSKQMLGDFQAQTLKASGAIVGPATSARHSAEDENAVLVDVPPEAIMQAARELDEDESDSFEAVIKRAKMRVESQRKRRGSSSSLVPGPATITSGPSFSSSKKPAEPPCPRSSRHSLEADAHVIIAPASAQAGPVPLTAANKLASSKSRGRIMPMQSPFASATDPLACGAASRPTTSSLQQHDRSVHGSVHGGNLALEMDTARAQRSVMPSDNGLLVSPTDSSPLSPLSPALRGELSMQRHSSPMPTTHSLWSSSSINVSSPRASGGGPTAAGPGSAAQRAGTALYGRRRRGSGLALSSEQPTVTWSEETNADAGSGSGSGSGACSPQSSRSLGALGSTSVGRTSRRQRVIVMNSEGGAALPSRLGISESGHGHGLATSFEGRQRSSAGGLGRLSAPVAPDN